MVFPEGAEEKILRACQQILDEEIAEPILLGDPEVITAEAKLFGMDLKGARLVHPSFHPRFEAYCEELFHLRRRHGVTPWKAHELMQDPTYFGVMMVRMGDADGLVCGLNRSYPETIRPALLRITVANQEQEYARFRDQLERKPGSRERDKSLADFYSQSPSDSVGTELGRYYLSFLQSACEQQNVRIESIVSQPARTDLTVIRLSLMF